MSKTASESAEMSSTSAQSAFTGISESCMSEASSSGLQQQHQRSGDEWREEEECPRCAAMKVNAIVAEEALAALSVQFKNLQKELKKTEQVSKINEEQARYIDERRSKLEKVEAERTAISAEFENLRLSHESLKRQYDEVIATARKNQRLIDQAVEYRENCQLAMERLVTEKEGRTELLTKYLKSVEAATKINDSLKQVEKQCAQLQATSEKLEPFRVHCPALLRLVLELGEIVENNGLMTKSLQRRLERYTCNENLRNYLLRKSRNVKSLSESSTKSPAESSDDEALAKGVEDLLMTIQSPPRSGSPKKHPTRNESEATANASEGKSDEKRKNSTREAAGTSQEHFVQKQSERMEMPLTVDVLKQPQSEKSEQQMPKTLQERQIEIAEKQKEAAEREILKSKGARATLTSTEALDPNEPSTSKSAAVTEHKILNTFMKRFIQQTGIPYISIKDRQHSINSVSETDKQNNSCEEEEISKKIHEESETITEKEQECLSRRDEVEKTDSAVGEASDQNSADEDLINSCFGAPLSPSSSSRRTSVSSLDGLLSPRRRINKSAEADANTSDAAAMIAETDLFGAPLSPSPAPESPAHDTKSSGSITTSEVSESLDVDRLAISCSTESVSFEANVQSEIGVSQIPTVSNTSEGPAVTKISKNSADTGKALNPAVLDNSEKSGVPGTVKDLAFSETSRDLSDSDTSKESVTPFASEDYSASTKLKNFAVLDVRKGKFSDTPKISTAAEVPEDFAAPDLSKSCSTTLDVSLKAKSSDSSVQHVIATPVSTVSLTHSLSIVIPRPRLRRISRRLDSQNDSESDSVWPTRSESRIPAQAEQVTEMLKKDAKQIQCSEKKPVAERPKIVIGVDATGKGRSIGEIENSMESFIRIPQDEVAVVLQCVKDKANELANAAKNESRKKHAKKLLPRSVRRCRRVRAETSSSEESQNLLIDAANSEESENDLKTQNPVPENTGLEPEKHPENLTIDSADDEPVVVMGEGANLDSMRETKPEVFTKGSSVSESPESGFFFTEEQGQAYSQKTHIKDVQNLDSDESKPSCGKAAGEFDSQKSSVKRSIQGRSADAVSGILDPEESETCDLAIRRKAHPPKIQKGSGKIFGSAETKVIRRKVAVESGKRGKLFSEKSMQELRDYRVSSSSDSEGSEMLDVEEHRKAHSSTIQKEGRLNPGSTGAKLCKKEVAAVDNRNKPSLVCGTPAISDPEELEIHDVGKRRKAHSPKKQKRQNLVATEARLLFKKAVGRSGSQKESSSETGFEESFVPGVLNVSDSGESGSDRRRRAHSPKVQKDSQNSNSGTMEVLRKTMVSESAIDKNKSRMKKSAATKTTGEIPKKQEADPKSYVRYPTERRKSETLDNEKQNDESCQSTNSSSATLGVRMIDSDSDEDEDRLQIVADEPITFPSTSSAPERQQVPQQSSQAKEKISKPTATKKQTSEVKSELYRKMHKRIAVQTLRMKELGRLKKPEDAKETVEIPSKNELPKLKRKIQEESDQSPKVCEQKVRVEKPSRSIPQKRSAILLPQSPVVLAKRPRDGGAVTVARQAKLLASTKAIFASDEAAVLSLFDQAVLESTNDEKLLEIVQKFRSPTISAMPCEKLADCCVKFVNKLDVGNMWHSVVHTVRLWSDKLVTSGSSIRVLELHQVVSAKERSFIEVLHQLSGEEQWSNIILLFLRKMIVSLTKTRLTSVTQHGRNIRCILVCARILLQDGSNEETRRLVSAVLRYLIERDTSDKVVPVLCYAVTIVPELADELLFEQNEQYEVLRRIVAVHLASRDELCAIFNKVIMSRLKKTTSISSLTCLTKLDDAIYRGWFEEAVNGAVNTSGLDLHSLEFSPELSSSVMTCCALLSFATHRLVPSKEALVYPLLAECFGTISSHFSPKEKELNQMFIDATEKPRQQQDELVKAVIQLAIVARLITSLMRSAECSSLVQISYITEEIYRFRETVEQKMQQGEKSTENRLLHFGLNDWLRVLKPLTKYVHLR